jgi:hypothetical protein
VVVLITGSADVRTAALGPLEPDIACTC